MADGLVGRTSASATEDFNEGLDPRIQVELERLNIASDEINKLEKEIDEARKRFGTVFSESSQKLETLHRKHRRSIEKSRPYYDAVGAAKKAHSESQQAAAVFRRATSMYDAAKETVEVAESRLRLGEVPMTDAWQEMLAHARQKMQGAEREKARGDLEHHRRSTAHAEAQEAAHRHRRKLRQHVGKALPYYEKKAEFELQLQQQKQNIEDLQSAVVASKAKYREAFANLEHISDEIHARRRSSQNLQKLIPPELPYSGSDSDQFESDIAYPELETNLEKRLVRCVVGSGSLNVFDVDDDDDDAADDNELDVDSLLSSDSGSSGSSTSSAQCPAEAAAAAVPDAAVARERSRVFDEDSDSAAWSSLKSTLERGQAAPLTCDDDDADTALQSAQIATTEERRDKKTCCTTEKQRETESFEAAAVEVPVARHAVDSRSSGSHETVKSEGDTEWLV